MNYPQYLLRQDSMQVVVTRVMITLVLCTLFYVGVIINLTLLEQNGFIDGVPGYLHVLLLIVLVLLTVLQGILSYWKTQSTGYGFYADRLEYTGKKPFTIQYMMIKDMHIHQSFWDKPFQTASIVFEDEAQRTVHMRSIKNFNQMYMYLQGLVSRYR
jgi:hypothetical protein